MSIVLSPCAVSLSIVIGRDLRRVAPETIRDARVLLTVVGGTVVYQAPQR